MHLKTICDLEQYVNRDTVSLAQYAFIVSSVLVFNKLGFFSKVIRFIFVAFENYKVLWWLTHLKRQFKQKALIVHATMWGWRNYNIDWNTEKSLMIQSRDCQTDASSFSAMKKFFYCMVFVIFLKLKGYFDCLFNRNNIVRKWIYSTIYFACIYLKSTQWF